MTELLLDYDGRLPAKLPQRVARLARLMNRRVVALRLEKTRHGWHVLVLLMRPMSKLAVVCWQLILGSDRERETFNFKRATGLGEAPRFWRTPQHRWNTFYPGKP